VRTSVKVPHSVVAVVTLYTMASRRDVYTCYYIGLCSKSSSHSHSEAVARVTSALHGDKLRSERARTGDWVDPSRRRLLVGVPSFAPSKLSTLLGR
jgi:hypothetical protein